MRYLLLLLLLLSLQGCARRPIFTNDLPIVDGDELTRQAVLFSHEMKAEHHLHLEHAYYCENRYDLLKTIYLEYWTQDQFEICKGRYILVDVVEGFLRRINENEILRGARGNLPFMPINLEIVIRSTTFYGKYDDILLTERICMKDGIVKFYAFDTSPNMSGNYVSDYSHRHMEEYGVTLANVSAEIEAVTPYYDKYRDGRLKTRMNKPPVPKVYPPIPLSEQIPITAG